MTWFVLGSTSWMASDPRRWAFFEFVLAEEKRTGLRLGMGPMVTLPLLSMTTGVSVIHSAVRCVEAYGTVELNDCPVVRSLSWMVQTLVLGTFSAIDALILSPAWIVIPEIVMAGAGISSYQAEYEAWPDRSTSCSVPVWISVVSVTMHWASTQPPPIPIQLEEYSASPGFCGVA